MFWFEKIKKPIVGLAPMHGFTNSAFRLLCRKNGADVVYSEMVAAEAIIRNVKQAWEMAKFGEGERPIIIQIFGSNPESMAKAAQIIETELSPDGIDINLGCPVQKAAKQGFGAIQLSDVKNTVKVISAISRVIKHTPLSAKIRLLDSVDETIEFINTIKYAGVRLVAIHGRTATQKYRGSADWEKIRQVKNNFANFPILGNGDIKNIQDLKSNIGQLDGVLIGRAAKIDPEIFQELKQIK